MARKEGKGKGTTPGVIKMWRGRKSLCLKCGMDPVEGHECNEGYTYSDMRRRLAPVSEETGRAKAAMSEIRSEDELTDEAKKLLTDWKKQPVEPFDGHKEALKQVMEAKRAEVDQLVLQAAETAEQFKENVQNVDELVESESTLTTTHGPGDEIMIIQEPTGPEPDEAVLMPHFSEVPEPESKTITMTEEQLNDFLVKAVQTYMETQPKDNGHGQPDKPDRPPPVSPEDYDPEVKVLSERRKVICRLHNVELWAGDNCPGCVKSREREALYSPPLIAIACPKCNKLARAVGKNVWECRKEKCYIRFDVEGQTKKIPKWG